MSRTALYRFYDDDGDLLYVGISLTPWARWKQHKNRKDWAEEVTTSAIEWFDSRPEALAAEKAAIIAEEPRYNVQHNRALPAPQRGPLRLTVLCSTCGDPIVDGNGIIECNREKALEKYHQRRAVEFETYSNGGSVDLSTLLTSDVYDVVYWRAWHDGHDPHPELDTYWFHVDRCRTLSQLFDWTRHLSEKVWFDCTNWMDALARMDDYDTAPLFWLEDA